MRSLEEFDEVRRLIALGMNGCARLGEFVGPKSVAVPWTDVHYTA